MQNGYWNINTNWGQLGRNALVRFDKKTGEILQKHLAGNRHMKILKAMFSLAVLLVNAATAAEPNVRTIPSSLIADIEKNPAILESVGKTNWTRLRDVSRQVETSGLTGISEQKYMPLPAQRELFHAVQNSRNIPVDIKLVLQDLIIQYYFFTYYYHSQNSTNAEFSGEHRRFLGDLGVEYVWVEPAAQNYYQHTFLKKLVQSYPESRWGKFYLKTYTKTGFKEIPLESEGQAQSEIHGNSSLRATAYFSGEVREGQVFEKPFGSGFHFRLEPRPFGWEIIVRYLRGEENIARLTPPFHSVPNPREIEGWHFRNSDNSGANEPGDKNVNAPQGEREFVFSPEVGRAIQGPGSSGAASEEDVERVRSFGRGRLEIVEYRLGNLKTGERARFEYMRFRVELSWPAKFTSLSERKQ
jgi:hypothetical protein